MSVTEVLLLPLVVIGHLGIWVIPYNRINGTGLPRVAVKVAEFVIVALLLAATVALLVDIWHAEGSYLGFDSTVGSSRAGRTYLSAAAVVGAGLVAAWCWRRWRVRTPECHLATESTQVNVANQLQGCLAGSFATRCLARIPGNQIFTLDVNTKRFRLDRLPSSLEGLTITHFSDLHFTGQIRREFFEFVVQRANQLNSDLIAITGDIVDEPHCVDWIPVLLGQLRAPLGVYFLLGNHDKKLPDVASLRRALTDAGLIDVGGATHGVRQGDTSVEVAGNELPWFKPPEKHAADDGQSGLRLLLSHSPDQFRWAQRMGFDVMLAGHTHGGQIRLPVVGPIIAPSLHGVKYASGVFHAPPTLMHVSRGLSGVQTIRINCAPELTQIVLEGPSECREQNGR